MRITFNSHFREAEAGLQRAAERMTDLQQQVATGRRLNKPSDAPADAAVSISERARIRGVEDYERTADAASARLGVVDGALNNVIDQIVAAQTATASIRGSGRTPAQREAIARQLQAISDSIRSDLNVSVQGAYVFAGTAATTQPFAADGGNVTYAGDAAGVAVDISQGHAVTIAFNGEDVTRGGAGTDLFTTLSSLVAAARSGDDTALADGMDQLAAAHDRATTVQARVGGYLRAIDVQKASLQQMRLSATARLSAVEDADMAAAVSGMTQADAGYRAALSAISTAGRVSLMDYLK